VSPARIALVGAVLAALLGVAGCSTGSDAVDPDAGGAQRFVAGSGEISQYAVGERKPAADVTGDLVDGGRFRLTALRGNVVVLNFWGSWCAPCRAEADDLQAVNVAAQPRGVRFVGVNIKDSESNAKAFERRYGVTYPSLFDEAGRVALQLRQFPPNAIPATIVIDRQGRVAAVIRKALLAEELQPIVLRVAAEAA
jgi:peroxiredoxin